MKNLRITAIVTAFIGLAASSYLAWAKVTHQNVVCIQTVGDCNLVNSSSYSEWRGIPIALLGVIGYVLILAILVAYKSSKKVNKIIPLTLFGITLFGALYSL
ncbi:MAG: vitamin K epoxide reductase family protein, partial [Anaerolineaceae bacterium]